MSQQILIQLKDVSKHFSHVSGTISVLRKLCFEVHKGESVAVVGPSGSGKSTLLSLLAGLDSPSQGEVIVAQQRLNELSEKDLTAFRSRYVGIVFQNFYLMPHLNAIENVALPLMIHKHADPFSEAAKALRSVGLWERQDHLPSALSGGECQRVALARAVVHHPPIILADEPTGSLDVDNGEKINALLFDLVEQYQSTLVLVTHNKTLADRCQTIRKMTGGRFEELLD